jgi:hypothetical protein
VLFGNSDYKATSVAIAIANLTELGNYIYVEEGKILLIIQS